MAAVPVTIVGIETRSDGSSENVTIVGMASLTGLAVGGGPIVGGGERPEHPIYQPPGIWGPTDPRPSHPIAPGGPPPSIWPSPGHPAHPIAPGGPPPSIWPSPGHPAHPIELPPDKPPTEPPTEPPTNPEDPNWTWGWSPSQGWHPVYTPEGGKPQPVP